MALHPVMPNVLSFPITWCLSTFAFMNDIISLVITSLVTLVTSSGLTALITSRSVRQRAKADAMKAVQDVYQETINDLRQDRQLQREEFERQVSSLKTDIGALQKEVDELKKLKCYDLQCPHRKRHS